MSIKENGYHLSKNLIDRTSLNKILDDIQHVFSNFDNSKNSLDSKIIKLFKSDFDAFYGCAQVCQNLLSVTSLSICPIIENELKNLGLSFPTINTRPLVHFSSKHTAKTNSNWKLPAHQDWPSTQGSVNGITCWIPLRELTAELGPLEVSKGTHKLGTLHHEEVDGIPVVKDDFKFESISMDFGDALFFNNFLVHRSGENTTDDTIRITTHFRYNDANEKSFIDRKYPRHRIDKRKEGILFPDFPDSNYMQEFFR